jgi:hypothetical protein
MRLLSRRRRREASHAGVFWSTKAGYGASWISRNGGMCKNKERERERERARVRGIPRLRCTQHAYAHIKAKRSGEAGRFGKWGFRCLPTSLQHNTPTRTISQAQWGKRIPPTAMQRNTPRSNNESTTWTNTNPNDTEANAAGRREMRVRSAKGTREIQGAWVAKSLTKSEALVGGAPLLRNTKVHYNR